MNTPSTPDSQSTASEQQENERTKHIAMLNDYLRTTFQGGRVVATQGVSSLPQETQSAIIQAIQTFSAFTPDNDPYKEHDCAVVEVQGIKVIWKFDYFAQDMMHHSPDKADPNVTNRVMTIMLANEY